MNKNIYIAAGVGLFLGFILGNYIAMSHYKKFQASK